MPPEVLLEGGCELPRRYADSTTELSTHAFLVAIEDEIPVTKEQVSQVLKDAFGRSNVDVEALGVIDVYNEDGTPKGPSDRTT